MIAVGGGQRRGAATRVACIDVDTRGEQPAQRVGVATLGGLMEGHRFSFATTGRRDGETGDERHGEHDATGGVRHERMLGVARVIVKPAGRAPCLVSRVFSASRTQRSRNSRPLSSRDEGARPRPRRSRSR